MKTMFMQRQQVEFQNFWHDFVQLERDCLSFELSCHDQFSRSSDSTQLHFRSSTAKTRDFSESRFTASLSTLSSYPRRRSISCSIHSTPTTEDPLHSKIFIKPPSTMQISRDFLSQIGIFARNNSTRLLPRDITTYFPSNLTFSASDHTVPSN